MKSKNWNFLKKNDIVDIIAPASPCPLEKLQDGVRWIEELKLIPRVPQNLIETDLFFAAPLKIQLEHLKDALYSDSKAIWCLRGGYGSMRLIPHLLKLPKPKKTKLFLGFSDITSLHLFFNQEWKWPTIHGRTISQLSPELALTPDRKFLKNVIFGSQQIKTFKNLTPLNENAKNSATIRGMITGGNLRIVQSSLGTDWEIKTRGKILFLEDVAERGYSVDRMLEQLYQAKIIHHNLKALVFGDFTGGEEKNGVDLTHEAMERFARRVNYPVLKGLPAGHGNETNFPIPFHTECELHTGKKSQLICHYGGIT